MDGLPKNKKPWRRADERDTIGLDNYLFERKLQEIYDPKPTRKDDSTILKAIKNPFKKFATTQRQATPKRPKKTKKVLLIDAPHTAPKRPVVATQQSKKRRHVKMPKVSLSKKARIGMGASLGIVTLVGVGIVLLPHDGKKDVLGEVTNNTPVAQKPDFEVLTPQADQTIASKVRFDATRRVASYIDKIGEANIVLNQQKLGETELKDSEFLRRTSLNFNLTKELTTKKGQAFIGENKEKNTLFSFFIYNDFLFLIQADKIVKYQEVVEYIDSLQ